MAGSDPIARGDGGNLERMVAVSGSWLLGARIVRTLLTLIGMMALARLLTPADFGVAAIAVSATVLSLLVLEGAIDFPALRNDDLTADGMRSLIWSAIAGVGAMAIALWFAAPLLERALGFERLAMALRGVIPAFFAQIWFVAGTAVLRRQHRYAAVAAISVASSALYMAIAVALAMAGAGLWSLIIGQVASMLGAALLFAQRAGIGLAWPRRFTLAGMRRSGASGAASRFLAWLWTNIDTFFVAAWFTPAATGLYSRAYNINVQMKEPFAAIENPIRAALLGLRAAGRPTRAAALQMLRAIVLAAGLCAAFVVVFRDEVIAILLGEGWAGAAPVLAILALSFPARIARMLDDGVSASIGSQRLLVVRQLVLLGVIGACLLTFGGRGIAWVAGAVSAGVYVAAFARFGNAETAHSGSLGERLAHMLPGLLAMAALVTAGEAIARTVASPLADALLRLALFALAGLACLAVPASWLPEALATMRAALLARLGLGRRAR
ncbi:oligosaccharide flippase family protein [Sphingomonas baiyangensis]|uniref:Lipopolysaccharide biosynthesis protein n=1 Tax=Sphingomonas baiyangensis TaxID=2572576 RepID=A0A4U1L0B1_9SPHN|nr:oligosaccharide flippase family protein [Sphingomonas baiyangensis]TKD50004.1 hypothetical protein FBR43_03955 [Sphingomonas baiyangensis]